MPRKPIDYSKSCVYRLIYDNETRYVGSTTNFTSRKGKHKTNGNSKNVESEYYNLKLYRFIRETGGWGDNKKWDMVLVEAYPNCKTSVELRKYERHHFDLLKPDLNTYRPYFDENNENDINFVREYKKRYRNENLDEIRAKDREYYNNNKEKAKQYRDDNKEVIAEKNKQYRDDNKDVISERRKQHRIANKDAINEKQRQRRADSK